MTTKFCYVRDARCNDRVLTIARDVVGDEIHFGYAINKVIDVDLSTLKDTYNLNEAAMDAVQATMTNIHDYEGVANLVKAGTPEFRGCFVLTLDKFDKKRGRQIAEGRMIKKPLTTPVVTDESPFLSVLRALTCLPTGGSKESSYGTSHDRAVKRIAKSELDYQLFIDSELLALEEGDTYGDTCSTNG